MDWFDPSYLARGNPRQQQAYRVINALGIMEVLSAFTPVLAGTVPLDIDIPGSDLDIICEARDLVAFERTVAAVFGARAGFRIERKTVDGIPRVVADFTFEDVPVQIFGQPRPVMEQNAYRHMVVEARLLALGGSAAREAIREMKKTGLKTEPALARYFGLPGDPYTTLLELERLDTDALRRWLVDRGAAALRLR